MKYLRSKSMVKKRHLYPDLGVVNDRLYNSTSSQTAGENMMPKAEREKHILSFYNQYKAIRGTVSVPDYSLWPLGHEQLNGGVVKKPLGWSNCVHTSQRSIQHPYGRIALKYNATEGVTSICYREPYWRKSTTQPYWRDACGVAGSMSKSDEQMFSARAYWSMRPKFVSDVSLINSIFELKDFSDIATYLFSAKGLTRAALKAAKSIKRFANHALREEIVPSDRNAWRRYSSEKLESAKKAVDFGFTWLSRPGVAMGDLTALGANAVLINNLAIQPTIKDAISIHAAAQKDVYDLARTFTKYGEEGARSHYTENTVLLDSLVFGTLNNALWGQGKYVYQTRSAMAVNYYQMLWQRLEDRYPKWWGLEIGADEIWNMLPLSFVLDYFFTVGKALEFMDVDKTINVHHVDYLETVKTLATSGTHYLHNARTSHLVINDRYIEPRSKDKCLLVTGTQGMYFKRQIKEPYKGPALPVLKSPSATQAVNLLALVRCLLF